MPYSLQGKCVIRSDTGAQVKCHPTRARALRHLAALQMNVPEAKAEAPESTKPKPHFANASERARHASLVRWKKENPLAANVQQRLAQIRAARVKKKAGGKGKGGKGKAAKPDKAAQAAQNRAIALGKLQNKPNDKSFAALDALRKGDSIDPDMGEALVGETGLVQKRKDGSYALSSAGRKLLSSLDKGDAAGAADAMDAGAAATDKAAEREQKKAEREQKRAERLAKQKKRKAQRAKKKAKPKPGNADRGQLPKRLPARKSMDDLQPVIDDLQTTIDGLTDIADAAIKAGRRNSGSDQAQIDAGYELAMQLCDLFESLGADTGEEEGEMGDMSDDEDAEMMGGKAADWMLDGDAVKALDGDRVGALAVRFGSANEPDLSPMRDYFTKSTDFWIDAWDRRPMLFHHAMDEDTADAPRIGTWTKAEIKDEGVWLEGQLDKGHRYYGAIKELVKRGVLRLSSDSAPHLVRREAKGNTHEVTRWPLLAASLTPTPAEPRLSAVSFKAFIAELGIDDTDNPEVDDHKEGESADGQKAALDRSRRLLLELDLLALEATIT